MATATWTCNKDARIASNGSNLGAGTSDYNPFGKYSGYQYRVLLGFPGSMAGWTSISGATLHYRTSTQYYVAFGSSPTALFSRITGAWSEGSSSGMSTGNAVVYPGPATTATNRVANNMPTSQSQWATTDITAMMRDVLAGGAFQGIQIIGWNGSAESTSAADVGEIYSREGGSAPYITFTYATNTPPTAPTLNAPADTAVLTGAAQPTLNFTPHDPQGDVAVAYHYQIALDAAFTSLFEDLSVSGSFADNVAIARVVVNAVARGTTYYWRVQTSDASGYGAWSGTQSFKINQLPTIALTTPSAANALVEMQKAAGGGVNPRMVVRWTASDPDGAALSSYRVVVVTDALGAFYDSNVQAGNPGFLVIPLDAVINTFYRVTVTVTDSGGESVSTAQTRMKAQWAVAEYRLDLGGAATAWSTSASSTAPANTAVVTEYASSAAGGAIGTWFSSLGSAALNRWFHFRVYLFAWNGAASPTFTKMALTFTNAVGVPPDGWAVTAQHAIDTSVKVYGTQSLRATCNGTAFQAYQQVPVQKNTNYILSGRIKSDGNSGALLLIAGAASGGGLVGSPAVVATQEWTRVQSLVWNSGDNDSIYIQCRVSGAAGATAWFDALKLEASTVVTAWTPGFIGAGTSVDAGGIRVDASPGAGGTFRLQGSAAGARDIVELGVHGLRLGGDVELYSGSAGSLQSDATLLSLAKASSSVGLDLAGGSLEIFALSNAFIDFKNVAAHDFDARIILGSAANPVGGLTILTPAVGMGISANPLLHAGLQRFGGTAFPASPQDGDSFFRTDHGMWWSYESSVSKWLSTPQTVVGKTDGAVMTATSGAATRMPVPYNVYGGSGLYIRKWFVASHPSIAQSATNYWNHTLQFYPRATDTPANTVAVVNSQGQTTAARWDNLWTDVNALVTTAGEFEVTSTLFGAACNLFVSYGYTFQWALP